VASVANRTLRVVLADYGLTQAELADQVNRRTEELFGEPASCTDVHVRRWLSGRTLWPWPRYLIALEDLFGRSAIELGFVPRGRDSVARLGRVRTALGGVGGPGGHTARSDVVERRRFLQLAGGVGAGAAAGSVLPVAGRIGMVDVTRVEQAIAELEAADDVRGGAGLAEVTEGLIGQVRTTMSSCSYSSSVENTLYSTLGTMSANAGWFAFDAENQEAARRHYDDSLRCALLAGDRVLQARVWSTLSMQSRKLGRRRDATTIAHRALTNLGTRDLRLASLLWMRASIGHAESGEARSAERALANAERLHADSDGHTASWLDFYNRGELLSLSGHVHRALGRTVTAQSTSDDALTSLPDRYRRNRAYYTVHLADCYLDGRQVDEAAAVGLSALGATAAVESPRVRANLSRFHTRISAFTTVPAVAEFRDAYAATASGREV
jgi:transcriptional regulator with XRE-family HTH domain